MQGFQNLVGIFYVQSKKPINSKKAKSFSLAPIAVEILLCRGSAQKIVTESGTVFPENAYFFLPLNLLIEIPTRFLKPCRKPNRLFCNRFFIQIFSFFNCCCYVVKNIVFQENILCVFSIGFDENIGCIKWKIIVDHYV